MTKPIPLAGVIGWPVSHSRSPAMHGHWLRIMNLPGHYIPLEVAQEDLARVLGILPKMGFVGVNVTVPHKEAVLNLATVVSDRAAVIGAANTLTFLGDGEIYADNTDGYGFLKNLQTGAPEWDPKAAPAVVYGAGGASRAVIAALIEAGVPQIRLSNRSRPRAEGLRSEFGSRIEVHEWVRAGDILPGAGLVVNTTSLGMTGKSEFTVPLGNLAPSMLVTDLVYTPLETRLLAAARSVGASVVDGLGMLMYQGVPGFERWFGVRPEVTEETRRATLSV